MVLGSKTMANIVIVDNDAQPLSGKALIINDFSGDLTIGSDSDTLIVGYNTFNHPEAGVAITNTVAPLEPVPGSAGEKPQPHLGDNTTNLISFYYQVFYRLLEYL